MEIKNKELLKRIGITSILFLIFAILVIIIPGIFMSGGYRCDFVVASLGCSNIFQYILVIFMNGLFLHATYAFESMGFSLVFTIIIIAILSWIFSEFVIDYLKKRANKK